jgi:hypothetical protein
VISASRREALKGALAAPAVAALPQSRWGRSEGAVMLHDPALEAGRRFAEAGRAKGSDVLAIDGDRIRFARAVFEKRPALVVGVSRPADALLIEDVAREAGYRKVATDGPLRDLIAASPDRGLVLGWVFAPRI